MSQTELTVFTIVVSALWLAVAGTGYGVFLWWRKRDRANRR